MPYTTALIQTRPAATRAFGWIQGRYNGGFMEELQSSRDYPPIELLIPSNKNKLLKITFSDFDE